MLRLGTADGEASAHIHVQTGSAVAEAESLQQIRGRLSAMRRWLSSGGSADPDDPAAVEVERVLNASFAECGGDPTRLSSLLSERCVTAVAVVWRCGVV